MKTEKQILFICTGNTCRSPMAAALFNQHAADDVWQARSAGIAAVPDQPASDHALQALSELYQIRLDEHRSTMIMPADLEKSSWILAMTMQQRNYLRINFPHLQERIFTISEFAGETERDVLDPYGLDTACYQATAKQLAELIAKVWRKLSDYDR